MIKWLIPSAVIAIHKELISEHGGIAGIRDQGLLDSALARPKNIQAYKKASIPELAAAYAYGIVKNHPFIDGNKRVGLSILAVFLLLNGYKLIASEADAVITIDALASGSLEQEALTLWVIENSIKVHSSGKKR